MSEPFEGGTPLSLPGEIRAEMARQLLSVPALAEKSGVHRAQINRKVTNEERALTITELESLSAALGVPAWELMRRATEQVGAA